MTEAMIIEAVRGVKPVDGELTMQAAAPTQVANPAAVERFQAAMGVGGAEAAAPVPFASEASAAWRSAQANNQGLLHRIRALSELRGEHSLSSAEMVELQYDIMNLSFQQEVVTKVVDKTSNAIQTLVKNQ